MSDMVSRKKILQDIHEALNTKDFDKAVSFFADDADDVSPDGAFKGKAGIKHHFEWMAEAAAKANVSDIKLTEVGVYGEADVLTHLYNMEGTSKKGKFSIPAVAIAEFKNGKIQRISSYYDRLTMAKQMASGVVATRLIKTIVGQMEKGSH
jgi:ketosteroid isomerase-like protein